MACARVLAAIGSAVAATSCLLVPRSEEPRTPCTTRLDATFIQLSGDQLAYDEARWREELALPAALGMRLLVVQYTGDARGPYDGRRSGRVVHRPVAALLAAAEAANMQVWLGLHHDDTWPSLRAASLLPPPLGNPRQARALGALCRSSPACAGWYLSQEPDDRTWAGSDNTLALRDHLARSARAVRTLVDKPVAIAAYFTGERDPVDHARWWADVAGDLPIDVLMLQDGVGTGRASPEQASEYLVELQFAFARSTGHRPAAIWSVAELFTQRHGPPVDDHAFAATPTTIAMLERSLAVQSAIVERIVGFSLFDYMDPRRGGAARQLHDGYAALCSATSQGR